MWIAGSTRHRLPAFRAKTWDHRFSAIGFRIARPLTANTLVAVDYVAEVVPAELVGNVTAGTIEVPCGTFDLCPVAQRANAFGASVSPLGVGVRVGPSSRLGLDVSIRGGIGYFDRNVPDRAARRLNFTANASSALRIAITRGARLRIGAMYAHISNGHTVPENPGINALNWLVGLDL